MLQTILKKTSRALVIAACFWLSEEKKVGLERWLRGRAEYRELQRADVVIAAGGIGLAGGASVVGRRTVVEQPAASSRASHGKPRSIAFPNRALSRARIFCHSIVQGRGEAAVRNWMGLEAICLAFYDDPAWVQRMMDDLAEFCCAAIRRTLEDVELDYVLLW